MSLMMMMMVDLQVVVEAAAQVHVSERHVWHFGMDEGSELCTDVKRGMPSCLLLLG